MFTLNLKNIVSVEKKDVPLMSDLIVGGPENEPNIIAHSVQQGIQQETALTFFKDTKLQFTRRFYSNERYGQQYIV